MAGRHFTNDNVVSVVMREVAAGSTSTTSSSVDMLGYAGVTFLAMFGALTASHVTSLKGQHSDDNSTFVDIAGSDGGVLEASPGTAASGKIAVLDIFRPTKRYVRASVQRATANAVINNVLAIRRGAAFRATTADSTVATTKRLSAPASGTA